MIKRFHKRQDIHTIHYRINERIFASQLRVLDSENKQIGVLSKAEALERAHAEGVDLVEIAPNAQPPVAKIVDFKKFLYQQDKKKREEKKKAKVTETKEVRVGPFMGENDLEVLTKRAQGFLEDGDKVRLVLKFRGRQVTHPEFGYNMIAKVAQKLEHYAKVEKEARLEGKQMTAILAPERKKDAKEENQKISSETL